MPNPIGAREVHSALPHLLAQTDWPLSQPADAAAALVHTIHIALGFRLVRPAAPLPHARGDETHTGDAEEHHVGVENQDDSQSEATYVNPDTDNDGEPGAPPPAGRLADDWNAHGEGSYVFEYKHEQSSMEFMIRVGRMGGRVQVDAVAGVSYDSPCSTALP